MVDPEENTLGADLLSDPKARVLRRSRVMELSRCFMVIKNSVFSIHIHIIDLIG